MCADSVTPSSLMEKFQLTDEDCSKPVSDIHLEKLCRTHCDKWRYLPPYLGLENTIKDDINRKPVDEREKRYDFLIQWKKIKGAEATYKALIYGLLEIECRSDVEYVCHLMRDYKAKLCVASTKESSNTESTDDVAKKPSGIQSTDGAENDLQKSKAVVNIKDLDPDTVRELKLQLESNRDRIKEKYASFVVRLCEAVEATGVSLKKFQLFLLGLSAFESSHECKHLIILEDVKDEIKKAGSIVDIFQVLTTECCSYINFGIFQSIISEYNINTSDEKLLYSEHLKKYLKNRMVSDFIIINPKLERSSKHSEKLIIKLDISLSSNITQVLDLKSAIAKILGLKPEALHLVSIDEGCVVVTFFVPATVAKCVFASGLTAEQEAEIRALSVLWLKCGDYKLENIFTLSEATLLLTKLKDLIKSSQEGKADIVSPQARLLPQFQVTPPPTFTTVHATTQDAIQLSSIPKDLEQMSEQHAAEYDESVEVHSYEEGISDCSTQLDSTSAPDNSSSIALFNSRRSGIHGSASHGSRSSSGYDLRGINTLHTTKIEVTNLSQSFYLEEYGLKLNIPAQSLPDNIKICDVTITVSLSGQYKFPEGTELVSPVFCLRSDPSCKFSHPLSLEIEHCALPENSSQLSMARAICTPKYLPYSFEKLDGGSFSKWTKYGAIALNSFSIFAVIQNLFKSRRYWYDVFDIIPSIQAKDIHFAITWDDSAHIKNVKDYYTGLEARSRNIGQPIAFERDRISLDIPDEGITSGGWKIYPDFPPIIKKRDVDRSASVSHCVLKARWQRRGLEVEPLEAQRMYILGTNQENNFFTIDSSAPSLSSLTERDQPKIRQYLLQLEKDGAKVAQYLRQLSNTELINVGTSLGLNYTKLSNKSVDSLLNDMVNSWLRKDDDVIAKSGPPSWESLCKALQDHGINGIVADIKEKEMKDKLY